MPTVDCLGETFEVDDAGYLTDPGVWTPSVAETLARRAGIGPLTDRHWTVIAQCREEAARSGTAPDRSRISTLSGLDPRELHRLFFADRPEELAARVAGLPNPKSPVAHRRPTVA